MSGIRSRGAGNLSGSTFSLHLGNSVLLCSSRGFAVLRGTVTSKGLPRGHSLLRQSTSPSSTEHLPSQFAIQQLFWQVFIGHVHYMSCLSDLSLLEKCAHAWNVGLCEDFHIGHHGTLTLTVHQLSLKKFCFRTNSTCISGSTV